MVGARQVPATGPRLGLWNHTKGNMGFSDWFKKGKQAAADNKDAVTQGIDKAADMADEKTGGKYSEHIDTGAEKAKDVVEGLGDE